MNLSNNFLVSLPTLNSGSFRHSLVYVDKHNGDGAAGWIVNRQLTDDHVVQRLRRGMGLTVDIPIYFGGPVESNNAVVLHSSDLKLPTTRVLTDELSVTRDKSIINIMNIGQFPEYWRVIVGCAKWGAGQVESELLGSRTNGISSWMQIPYSKKLMWNTLPSTQWEKAIEESAQTMTNNVLNF